MTLEREIRGLRPFNDRVLVIAPEDDAGALVVADETPSSAVMLVVSPPSVRFFTGVGIPDCWGSNKGLLNIAPDLGERGPAGEGADEAAEVATAGLLVMGPNALCEYLSSETVFSPAPEVLVAFANELVVGAQSLEDVVVETLELAREAMDEEPLPRTFLDPMLPTVPWADNRVVLESLLPIDETFVLLVLERVVPVPVPTTELVREEGLAIELVRLERVPPLAKDVALLCRLFLLEVVLKEGIGEREREDVDAMEPLVVVVAESPFS